MGFNADRFNAAAAKPREDTMAFPELAAFFDEGERPVWTVRGLTGPELFVALEAEARHAGLAKLVEAAASSTNMVNALRAAAGIPVGTPGEMAKRLEMLVAGSVNPKVDLPTAVNIATRFPIDFINLTQKISVLTGKGFDLGKPVAVSQQTPASSQACESPSSEAATSTSAGPT